MSVPGKERRKEPRIRSRGPVIMRVSEGAPVPGTIYDVSPSGLSVVVETAIQAGEVVHIESQGLEGEASVRYCRPHKIGYIVGLEWARP